MAVRAARVESLEDRVLLTATVQDLATGGITAEDLVQSLIGAGVTVSNVTFTGNLAQGGLFQNGNSENLGINTGVVLSSGKVLDAPGPNDLPNTTTNLNGAGDADLNTLISGSSTTRDAVILEFDFVSATDSVSFSYVFASEEYPEFAPPNSSTFNDVFGFFLNGNNIAFLPGTTTPVSINNVNAVTNSQYYRSNTANQVGTEYDGLTTVFSAIATVAPNTTHHIKLAVADVGDGSFDSAVFLQGGSFIGLPVVDVVATDDAAAEKPLNAGEYTFTRTGSTTNPLTVHFNVSGVAKNGIDYVELPTSVTFPAGAAEVSLDLTPIEDPYFEPVEDVVITLASNAGYAIDAGQDSATVNITSDDPVPTAKIIDNGDPGFSVVGSWSAAANPTARQADVHHAPAGTGNRLARWQFTGLIPGIYQVAATWSAHENRASDSPFVIRDANGGDALNAMLVNQKLAPNDFSGEGSVWEQLAIVTVTGSTLAVELGNLADGYVIADAIRIIPLETVVPVLTPIIDDGDAGFATSGTWNVGLSTGAHNGDLRSSLKGNGSDKVTWTFTGLTPGNYLVSGTWLANPNRATDAPFTFYDGTGGTALHTQRVNQERTPNDFYDRGSYWERLAVVSITGSELVVELTDDANQYVVADALRIEMTSEVPSWIIDNGNAGFANTNGWTAPLVSHGFDDDQLNAPAGDGSQVATWTFEGLEPGNYYVAATWTASPNRATNAPFSIRDGVGGPLLEKTLVNQKLAPNDFTSLGTNWENLALVQVTGSTLVVELANDANQYVIADAIRLQSTLDPPPPLGTIIDDGDPEFGTTVGWNPAPLGLGYEEDARNAPSGDGSRVATWTFENLAPGEYTIAATWTPSSNRATDAPFTAFNGVGGTAIQTVDVNQQQAPNDFSNFGASWENLMTVLVTEGTLVVELTNDANGYVVADAVRIAPATPSPADPIAIDGSFVDWAGVPTYSDPADDQHDTDHDQAGDIPDHVNHPDVDLLSYKVTHDAENFYFFFEATGEIGRTQVLDLANGLRAGRYYVIVTIDVDSDDVTGYPLYEGGYYTGTTDTTGYDMNAEIEFFNGQFNTGHYLQHGARNALELQQAFADQSKGEYLWNGPATQGPFMPGFVRVLPGSYDFYTQWSYHENSPSTSADDQITFVQDQGPVVSGNVTYAFSPDNHMIEMKVPFKGFLKDENGDPIIQIGKFVDLSFSLEASGELGNDVSPQTPNGIWGSDTGEPINRYFLRPVS